MKNLARKSLALLIAGGIAMGAAPAVLDGQAFAQAGEKGAEIDAEAKKVLDRALKAQFGKRMDITSTKRSETLEIPAQGMSLQVSSIAANGKIVTRTEMPGMGVSQSGYNREVDWSFSELGGPALMTGAELRQIRRQSDIYADKHWDRYYDAVRYQGLEQVEGYDGEMHETHVLALTPKDGGDTERRFYDTDTGLLVRMEGQVAAQGGANVPMTMVMGDYREVDGVQVAFKSKVRAGPNQFQTTVNSVEYGVDVPDDAFALPEEVAELAE